MSEEWLSLGEAATLLGVHPSTVRSWSDRDQLATHRTPGGHRRFRREDVEMLLRQKQEGARLETAFVVQSILRTARLTIGEGRLENEDWYLKLDEEARQQYRLSGRSLVHGLVSHLNTETDGMEAEARSLGYEYASRGRRCGLSSIEAAHAFLFFRTMVMDSILEAYESAGLTSPKAWSDMLRKMNRFSDLIMITLLETYGAYQRSGK